MEAASEGEGLNPQDRRPGKLPAPRGSISALWSSLSLRSMTQRDGRGTERGKNLLD
jgi:hypothetical protein